MRALLIAVTISGVVFIGVSLGLVAVFTVATLIRVESMGIADAQVDDVAYQTGIYVGTSLRQTGAWFWLVLVALGAGVAAGVRSLRLARSGSPPS